MKTKMKKIAILTSALIALSGCLDDPFDYPDGKGGATGGEVTQLYGQGSTGAFMMQATDKADVTADVDGQANSALSNIQVIGDYANQGALNVVVTDEDKASIQLVSNSGVDLSKPNTDGAGVLLFDIKVNDFTKLSGSPAAINPVSVTLTSGGTTEASVDITSTVSAFLGATNTQTVRLPLNCFADKGVDLSKSTQPFSLKLSSNINADISNIRFQAEAGGDTPGKNLVGDCDIAGEKRDVLIDAESIVYQLDGTGESGWASYSTPNGGDINGAFEGIPFRGIEADEKNTKNIFLTYLLNEANLKDFSQYLEKGVLQFDLYVESNSSTPHPTGNIVVKMETPSKKDTRSPLGGGKYRYPTSEYVVAHNLNSDPMLTVRKISLPLKKFFVREDGSLDVNSVKYIQKVVIFPDTVDKDQNYSPYGVKFYANNLKLVMNPTP